MNTKNGKRVKGKYFVQGDIPFRYIEKLPKNVTPRQNPVIALGEATGHKHMVEVVDDNVELFNDALGNLFMLVKKPVRVLHNKHAYALFEEPGVVQIGSMGLFQVEYDGEEERRAID